MVVLALILNGDRRVGHRAPADRLHSQRGPGLCDGRARSFPTAPRSNARAPRWRRSPRSPATRPAWTVSIAISGVSVLDNNASLANAGVAYVILKDWGVARAGKRARPALHHPGLAGRARKTVRRRGLSAGAARRFRASATPAASPCRSSCATAASITRSSLRVTNLIVEEGNSQSALQRLVTSFRAEVPQLKVTVDRSKAETLKVSVGDVFSTIAVLSRLELCESVQQIRPARFQVYVQADSQFRLLPERHPEALCAQPGRQHGADRSARADRAGRRSFAGQLCSISIRRRRWRARPRQGFSSGAAMSLMEQIAAKTLPPGAAFEWSGDVLSGKDRRPPTLLRLRACDPARSISASPGSMKAGIAPLSVILAVPLSLLGPVIALNAVGLPTISTRRSASCC